MNARIATVAAALAMVSTPAFALKLMPKKGFEIYSVDGKGGGWVIHRAPGRGDTIWGCKDLAKMDKCTQVYFAEWKPAAVVELLHVSEDSNNAWMVLKTPAMSDVLFACKDPEGTPTCEAIDLEMHMKLGSISRTWPSKECDYACGDGDGCAKPLPGDDPRVIIEAKGQADIWLSVGPKIPGDANLYSCTGLAGTPSCSLALPNWLAYDREKLGFKKLEDVEGSPGAIVSKIDEETAAWEAGFREGTKIVKVNGFEVKNAKHAGYMMSQFPAETPFMVELGDGSTVELKARRKPKKD